MALNANSVLKIDTGHYFTAPVSTALPTDLTAPEAAWIELGHTSIEDIMAASSEGGEATVLGTLQNRQLRTTYSTRTESFDIQLQQFDADSLKLYFGSNMVDVNGDGSLLGVPSTPTPTQSAFLAVYYDGERTFAIYMPKAEILRGDDFQLEDTENLSSLPIRITPLIDGTNTWSYAITPVTGV